MNKTVDIKSPEEILEASYNENAKPLLSSMPDFSELNKEGGYDWIYKAIRSYHDQFSSPKWVRVSEKFPEEIESCIVRNRITKILISEIEEQEDEYLISNGEMIEYWKLEWLDEAGNVSPQPENWVPPTDEQISEWYSDNIDKDCSASSAIYKFILWLKSHIEETPGNKIGNLPVEKEEEDSES